MKVLYVTTLSRTINAFLVPHIEMLLENDYEVHCACFVDKEIDRELVNKGVKVINIPFTRNPLSFNNIKAFRELIRLQKINNYDIVHVHTPIASIFGRLLKLRFNKLKIIYTAHGYHFLKGGSKVAWLIYYPLEKIMAKLTDITITINKEDFEITKKKLKPKNCYLVNGVGLDFNKYKQLTIEEIENKRKEIGLEKDEFVLIMIAELNGNKNQIQLIKAMEILKDKYPKIKAILVGEGNKYKELIDEITNRGLLDNIKLLGFRTDINELINISDVGILLSYREGLPRNIMEIIANGKYVIATDIRGNRDIIYNNEIGELVKVGDYKKTAEVIEECYKNIRKVNLKYCQEYDIKTICSKLLDIYKSLK